MLVLVAAGGGGGGGAQRLSVATMGGGVRTEIADSSSCWAATGTRRPGRGALTTRFKRNWKCILSDHVFHSMDGINWENTDWSLLGESGG